MIEFKDIGLKPTPQRVAIIEYLDGNKNHPSAEDIFGELKKKYPMISFATVYKTLEALKNRGLLREIMIDRERKHFDPDTSHHHHIICIGCKRIVDIQSDFSIEIPDEQKNQFEVLDSEIEFYGICPNCKKKGEHENGSI